MQGYAVPVKTDCPHVLSVMKQMPTGGLSVSVPCESCQDATENWVCLTCFTTRCSRYVKEHMIEHYKETAKNDAEGYGHCVVSSYSDISVWCFQCSCYIADPELKSYLDSLRTSKFGSQEAQSAGTVGEIMFKMPGTQVDSEAKDENLEVPEAEKETNNRLINEISDIIATLGISDSDLQFRVGFRKTGFWLALEGKMTFDAGSLLNIRLAKLQKSEPKLVGISRNARYYQPMAPRPVEEEDDQNTKMTKAELIEYFDSPEVLKEKCIYLAGLIKNSEHFVAHTGAGISTASKIRDYRGPDGCWTRRDRNLPSLPSVSFENAKPSSAHMALVKLQNEGVLKYLVSQNVDGLHRRSGIREDMISELHGNAFRETCPECRTEYLRDFSTTKLRISGPDPYARGGFNHLTGRKCECGGPLRDTIIAFTETLPEKTLDLAFKNSEKCDVSLCLGTSLRVAPASELPSNFKKHGVMNIVNLQHTPKDEKALRSGGVLVHGRIDEVMKLVMAELGLAQE